MSYKVVRTKEIVWPIKVYDTPNGTSTTDQIGTHVVCEFWGVLRKVPSEEIESMTRVGDGLSEIERCKRMFLGWRTDSEAVEKNMTLLDEDGKVIECTPENIEMVLSDVPLKNAVLAAWTEAVGGHRARLGN